MTETEIKLCVEDVAEVRRRLRQLGWRISAKRYLEENWVYDRPDHSLLENDYLLRVRQVHKQCTLTVKCPPEGGSAHKVREEFEIENDDPEETRNILEALQFESAWRYEKFRTEFKKSRQKGKILLDETPIGNYLELEGEPSWIDRTAEELGFGSSDYNTKSYRTLFLEHIEGMRPKPRHMLFEEFEKKRKGRVKRQ